MASRMPNDALYSIISIGPIIERARNYLQIGTNNDILLDIDNKPVETLTLEQINEKRRRSILINKIMKLFHLGKLEQDCNIENIEKLNL